MILKDYEKLPEKMKNEKVKVLLIRLMKRICQIFFSLLN